MFLFMFEVNITLCQLLINREVDPDESGAR